MAPIGTRTATIAAAGGLLAAFAALSRKAAADPAPAAPALAALAGAK
jgi:hypothetical protein